MIVVVREEAEGAGVVRLRAELEGLGYVVQPIETSDVTMLSVSRNGSSVSPEEIEMIPGVARVIRAESPFRLAGRASHDEPTSVRVGGLTIGPRTFTLIAGPCAVESQDQISETARVVAGSGIGILRGGAFKPRTSPYSFQGLGAEGVAMLRRAADENGLLVVSEVMDSADIPVMVDSIDILQVGARNMQNYSLLKALGRTRRPILLKRGMAATLDELLLSAEYILDGGNTDVILCERGIRTFEQSTRNTLDLGAIPAIKEMTHLPIIVDPSHASGRRNKVIPLARAAAAVGADGVMVEVHPNPLAALSDGPQSLYPRQLGELVSQVRKVAHALGRSM